MTDCIFCKIVNGEIPSKKVYEDDQVLAFLDIEAQAPVHILAVPKRHIASAHEIDKTNSDIVAHIFAVAPKIAEEQGIAKSGYRILTNVGTHGGQSVPHLHFHILGGKQLPLTLA